MHHSHSRTLGILKRSLLIAALAGGVPTLLTMTASTAIAAHSERSERQIKDDKNASDRVHDALKADVVKFPHVHVMTLWGVTQLSGFVDTGEHRDQAVEIAKRVVGNTGKIENSLSVMDDSRQDKTTSLPERSAGEIVDDKKINAAVRDALSDDSLKYPDVGISTYRGVVQLAGFVSSADQKKRAGEIAERIAGVKDVENHITVVEHK